MSPRKLAMGVVLGLALSACGTDAPIAPDVSTVELPGVAAAIQQVEGKTGPGSLYALFVPSNWNGDLAIYAHGFVDAALPVALPTNDDIESLRDALLQRGYAVAYSSYSENGYALKDGMRRTQQLRGIFRSRFERPHRTYIIGHSLGGMVTMALAETYPNHYDGALPMCGVLGGSLAEIDYLSNVRVLFDFFYPGVVPGSLLDIPPGVDLNTQVIGPIIAAISADPTGAGAMASIDQTPIPFSSGPELVESIITAVAFNFRGLDDILGRTHGHSPLDNASTVYTSSLLPPPLMAAVNAGVERASRTPDAVNYLEKYYEPTGDLRIPMLTLHGVLDPLVPVFNEGLYQQVVAGAGNSHHLVQRSFGRYGHCTFTVAEMIQGFEDLVAWVEQGVVPTP